MTPEHVRAMLDNDGEEWEALVLDLEAHPGQVLHDPQSPGWTARDVYAHLARWMEHSTSGLEAYLAGRAQPPSLEGSDDEINARWQAEDAGLALDVARARAEAQFERRIAVIESVPADRWDKLVEAFAHADGAQHYRAHRNAIVKED
jgi:hypothetical protein